MSKKTTKILEEVTKWMGWVIIALQELIKTLS